MSDSEFHHQLKTFLKNGDLWDAGDYKVPNFIRRDDKQDIKEHLETFRQIPVRDDDVITVGYVRSGNHWTYEIIGMILIQQLEFTKKELGQYLAEHVLGDVFDTMDKRESPRQLVSHFRIESVIPQQAIEKKTKIVYLLRNPKDVLISWYRMITSFGNELEKLRYSGSFDEFLQLDATGEFYYGTWYDHVLSTERLINEHPDLPVHIHVFEEMKANPEESITKLCRFLGYPEDIAPKIVEKTKLEKMSQDKKYISMDKRFSSSGSKFLINKGETGGWKNILTDEQNQFIDEMFERKLSNTRLGDIVRPYLKK